MHFWMYRLHILAAISPFPIFSILKLLITKSKIFRFRGIIYRGMYECLLAIYVLVLVKLHRYSEFRPIPIFNSRRWHVMLYSEFWFGSDPYFQRKKIRFYKWRKLCWLCFMLLERIGNSWSSFFVVKPCPYAQCPAHIFSPLHTTFNVRNGRSQDQAALVLVLGWWFPIIFPSMDMDMARGLRMNTKTKEKETINCHLPSALLLQ